MLPYNVVLYTLAAFLILALVSYKRLLLRYIFIYVSVFLLGAILYYNAVKEYSLKNESRQNFNAVITSSPSPHGKIVRCDIVVTSGKMKGRKLRASIMRDTIEQRYLLLKVGSGISCDAIVAPAKDFSDGHFSYSRYLMSNSISGTAFVPLYHWKQERVPLSSLSTSDRLRLVASKYRLKLIERYQSSGLSDLSLSLVSAMTLGERSMISKEIRDEFSITGTSHVLAMSGLHLSILYMFLTFAWGRRKRWVLVSFVNIIMIWAFVFIAGLPLSLVRSAIMLTTHSVLSVARRDSLSLNTLSLAALIIIIGNPNRKVGRKGDAQFPRISPLLEFCRCVMCRPDGCCASYRVLFRAHFMLLPACKSCGHTLHIRYPDIGYVVARCADCVSSKFCC